jgi:hypothetical protein
VPLALGQPRPALSEQPLAFGQRAFPLPQPILLAV